MPDFDVLLDVHDVYICSVKDAPDRATAEEIARTKRAEGDEDVIYHFTKHVSACAQPKRGGPCERSTPTPGASCSPS